MANLTINTTQNIKIEFKSASLGERMLASILDVIFKGLYLIVLFYILSEFRLLSSFIDDWSKVSVGILCASPALFYSLFFESIMQGATPGKKILKLKVIKIDGYEATVVDYASRWVMRLVDFWISSSAIGLISIAVTDKSQRLGDILAGTSVISVKERVLLSNTIFVEVEEEYKPTFTQVLILSDKDVYIVKEALAAIRSNKDVYMLQKLVFRLKNVLDITDVKSLSDQEFIETVLKDYNFLTAKA